MARVIVTLKIMPKGLKSDLSSIESKSKQEIETFAGKTEMKSEIEPIAFGLKALKLLFVMDEGLGSTEELEKRIKKISGVKSVEVTDVRRAIG